MSSYLGFSETDFSLATFASTATAIAWTFRYRRSIVTYRECMVQVLCTSAWLSWLKAIWSNNINCTYMYTESITSYRTNKFTAVCKFAKSIWHFLRWQLGKSFVNCNGHFIVKSPPHSCSSLWFAEGNLFSYSISNLVSITSGAFRARLLFWKAVLSKGVMNVLNIVAVTLIFVMTVL